MTQKNIFQLRLAESELSEIDLSIIIRINNPGCFIPTTDSMR